MGRREGEGEGGGGGGCKRLKKVGTPMLKGDGYFLTALRKGE